MAAKNTWLSMSPEQQAKQLQLMQLQEIGNQRQSLAQQQGLLPALANFEAQDNLQPLVNLTDQWSGSNFSQGYKAPESAADRAMTINKLQSGIADKANEITKSQLGVLKEAVDQSIAEKRLQQMAAKASQRPLGPTDVSGITDTDMAINGIETLKQKIATNPDLIGPVSGFAKLNPWATQYKAMEADINNLRQTLGKAKEGGVLRKEDELKYEKIVGSSTDTPEVIMHKLDELQKEMISKRNTHLGNLEKAKYDVSGFAKTGPSVGKTLSTKDQEAIKWAQKNKNSPEAQAILKLHGM